MTYESSIASTIRLQGENSAGAVPLACPVIASTIRLQGENSLPWSFKAWVKIASTIRLQGENSNPPLLGGDAHDCKYNSFAR